MAKKEVKKVIPKKPTTKPNVKNLSIYEKVYNVQQNVAPVFKRNPGEAEGYPYTRERDVIGEVKPMLKEQRLMYYFTTKQASVVENDQKKRKVTLTFTLVNLDKPTETITTDMDGEGQSENSAGIAAAYTMAVKYYLSKMFMVEIEDSIDEPQEKKGATKSTKALDKTSEYEKSKKLISSTRNIDGLLEFIEQLRTGKFFTPEQKADLEKLAKDRVTELQNG